MDRRSDASTAEVWRELEAVLPEAGSEYGGGKEHRNGRLLLSGLVVTRSGLG